MATAGVTSYSKHIGSQQYSFEELHAITVEAARRNTKVAAHAHYEPGTGEAVRTGVAFIEYGSVASKNTFRK